MTFLRADPITKGKKSLQTSRYEIQKGTLIKIKEDYSNKNNTFSTKRGELFECGGTQMMGSFIYLFKNGKQIKIKGKKRSGTEKDSKVVIPTRICEIVAHKKGMVINQQNQ